MSDIKQNTKVKTKTKSTQDISARIILFNDEWHTFEEVIDQIILATGYRTAKAQAKTWEVHTKGKSTIYSGDLHKCLNISCILEKIGLSTEVQY